MVDLALRLYIFLSAMSVLWFIFVPSKSAMEIAGDEKLVLPRRKYLPVIVVIWFGMLGGAFPLAVYIEWQLMLMGGKFDYSLLPHVALGVSIAVGMALFMRPRIWCSSQFLRYQPIFGRLRTMAWSDISSARWSIFHGALLLTNRNGSVVAIKSSYDGFLEFMSDFMSRPATPQPSGLPEKWRQRITAYSSNRIPLF